MQPTPNVAIVTTQEVEFPHHPFNMTCPSCKFTGLTRVEKKMAPQFFVCLIICIIFFWSLIGLILLCCLCCNENNFDYTHYCGNCNGLLGSKAVITTRSNPFGRR